MGIDPIDYIVYFKPVKFGEFGFFLKIYFMISRLLSGQCLAPIGAYVVVISLIALTRKFLPSEIVFFVAAALMFGVPFIIKSEPRGLSWNLRGVLLGLVISVIILSLYVLVIRKPFDLSKVSYSLIIVHLLLIAIPEEVFFRGYLQEKIGNNLMGILLVSLLFAIGHIITRCFFGGCSGSSYAQALLTFFPSIVMGYVYLISGTLWANILFHFLANVVYVATGGL
jgi:hypothetical protein